MRRSLIILGLLFCVLPATTHASTIAFVSASATACPKTPTGTTVTCTLAASTISGNTVIVAVSQKTVTGNLTGVTSSPACQFFVRAKKYANGASDAVQFAVGQNCPALTSVTPTLSSTSIFETGVVEYSGVSSIGLIANTSTTGNNTHPTQSITLQDANNFVVGFSASIGSNGVPTSNTGNLRVAGRTGSAGTDAALGIIDNTAASGSVTVSDTITSSQWAEVAIELRTVNPTDPLLVDAFDSSTDAGSGNPEGNDYVYYLPQPTLSGNGVVCGMSAQAGFTITISDSTGGSNTWLTAATATGAHNIAMIFYSVGMVAGTAWIKVHATASFSTGGTGTYDPRLSCKEAYHLASLDAGITSTAVSQAGPIVAAGSLTPSQANDLIFNYVGSDLDYTSAPTNVETVQVSPAITPGANFSLIATNTTLGEGFQDFQQGAAAAINPSMDIETAQSSNAVAAAFKTDSSGTLPPATGIHIDHQTTFVIIHANETFRDIQIPADGNFIAISTTNSVAGAYTNADSHQNTYTQDLRQTSSVGLFYATNASVDASQMVHVNTTATGGNEYVIRDIRGAKISSPLCQTAVSGGGTQVAPYTFGAAISNIPTITPCAAGNLMIWAQQNGCGPPGNLSGPSGVVTDNVSFTGQGDGSDYDKGEGHGHYITVGTSPVNFNLVMQNDSVACGGNNTYTYAVWEISAIPAPAVTNHAPPMISMLEENK